MLDPPPNIVHNKIMSNAIIHAIVDLSGDYVSAIHESDIGDFGLIAEYVAPDSRTVVLGGEMDDSHTMWKFAADDAGTTRRMVEESK